LGGYSKNQGKKIKKVQNLERTSRGVGEKKTRKSFGGVPKPEEEVGRYHNKRRAGKPASLKNT